jgi:hypothetical protein
MRKKRARKRVRRATRLVGRALALVAVEALGNVAGDVLSVKVKKIRAR